MFSTEKKLRAEELEFSLRRVRLERYPELSSYTRGEIYGHGDQMSPGALFLAARMARSLEVRPGDLVLDVGCGLGETSIFLARHYGVKVVAVDLGTPARLLSKKFSERGYRDTIIPLNLDITEPLPFAEEYFDAVFCMTSIHYFGVTTRFLRHLLRYLKKGGRFSVGNTCFDREIPPDQVRTSTELLRRETYWMAGKVSARDITRRHGGGASSRTRNSWK